MRRRLEFIWWGFGAKWQWGRNGVLDGHISVYRLIYDWTLDLGPLEIRMFKEGMEWNR